MNLFGLKRGGEDQNKDEIKDKRIEHATNKMILKKINSKLSLDVI